MLNSQGGDQPGTNTGAAVASNEIDLLKSGTNWNYYSEFLVNKGLSYCFVTKQKCLSKMQPQAPREKGLEQLNTK